MLPAAPKWGQVIAGLAGKRRAPQDEKDGCQQLSFHVSLKAPHIQQLLCKAPFVHDDSQACEALQGMTQHAEHAPQCSISDVL